MNFDDIEKLSKVFEKLSAGLIQPDTSKIIENALYLKYGNPPMKMINAISDKAYDSSGSASLLVETTSGRSIVKFDSNDNPLLATELQSKFSGDIMRILKSLQMKNPKIPKNEWSFFSRDFIILGG